MKMLTVLLLLSLTTICFATFTAKGEEWDDHSAKTYINDYRMIKENISKLPPGITIYGASRYYTYAGASIYIREFTSWLAHQFGQNHHLVPIKTGGLAGLLTSSLEGFASGKDKIKKNKVITVHSEEDEKRYGAQAVNLDRWMEPVQPVLIPNYYAVHHMTLRKWGLFHNSLMYILCPGGLGTIDEFFDTWNRVLLEEKIGRPKNIPSLVLVGSGFWRPILRTLKDISRSSEYGNLIPQEAFGQIKNVIINQEQKYSDEQKKEFTNLINAHVLRFQSKSTEMIDRDSSLIEDLYEIEQIDNEITISGGENLNPWNSSVQIIKNVLQKEASSLVPNFFRLTSSPDASWANELNQHSPRILRKITPHSSFMRTESVLQKADANIFLPGDIATLTQFASILDQVQLGLIPKRPIILIGKDFWTPIYRVLGPLFTHKSNLHNLISISDDEAHIRYLVDREK